METTSSEPAPGDANAAAVQTGQAEPSAAQALRVDDRSRCPGCEYDLRGLAAGQKACPECGTDITDAGKKYRAVLAARRLRLSRWLFLTSPATALIPLAFGSYGVAEAVRWLAYLVLAWSWLSAWWCFHNELPTPHWGERSVQAVGAAILAAFYFAMFWAGALVLCLFIAGVFRL